MQTKKEKKKLEIVLKTYDLLIEKGVDKFSLNNLLETISMSKGNFYHYFKNLDELYFETLKVALTNIYIKFQPTNTPSSFEEKLSHTFFQYLSSEKEIKEYLSLVNQMYYLYSNEKNTFLYGFMQENYKFLFQELSTLIEDEINNKNIKEEAIHMVKPIAATADGMLTHSFMLKDYNLQKEMTLYFQSISEQYSIK